jgi:hypothetical protein
MTVRWELSSALGEEIEWRRIDEPIAERRVAEYVSAREASTFVLLTGLGEIKYHERSRRFRSKGIPLKQFDKR